MSGTRYELRSVTGSPPSASPSLPKIRRKNPKANDPEIFSLPEDIVLLVGQYLDSESLLNLWTCCRWFYHMLKSSNPFWKALCIKEDLISYPVLANESQVDERLGWRGYPLRVAPPKDYPSFRRFFLKGVRMRRNIRNSNFEGWRIYANSEVPVVRLSPDTDLNTARISMGNFSRLSADDDLKWDWNDKYLVVFRFFCDDTESCVIRLWDIKNEPKFLYSVEKSLEFIAEKVMMSGNYVVIVPSWPLTAHAVVMALDIQNEMKEAGKFFFTCQDRRRAIDELWSHTKLKVVKNKAMVICQCPQWTILIVSIPSCELCVEISLALGVPMSYECQLVRSYNELALIQFCGKTDSADNILVTVDMSEKKMIVRSIHNCKDIVDVALFADPEEIYLMKRNGDVVLFDAKYNRETVKIKNNEGPAARTPAERHSSSLGEEDDDEGYRDNGEFQLFVNRRQQICVLQCASEVSRGRYVKVYSYSDEHLYTINLDLCCYGISRDDSICIYTNGAFLAVADSKKFALFNVKNGDYAGSLHIPTLERSKGKHDKDCVYQHTGLTLFFFDEDKLIAVHDYERFFPAVLDIYKFW